MIKDEYHIVDLTHSLNSETISWTGGCGFTLETKLDYDEGIVRVQQYKMHAGIGTHMDAPAHICPGGASVGDLPIENFFAPLIVIDLSARCSPGLKLDLYDIKNFEQEYGQISSGAFVAFRSGWGQYWGDKERYRNSDALGIMHFPHYCLHAASLLIERGVAGIGIDTLSPDPSEGDFPVHRRVLEAGKYILENLASLDQVPPVGAEIVALPLKIDGGVESAVRTVALVPFGGRNKP